MAVDNNEDPSFGFVDTGAPCDGPYGVQKSCDTMGLPLLPPLAPVTRKKRPLDYLVCVLVVVSIYILHPPCTATSITLPTLYSQTQAMT